MGTTSDVKKYSTEMKTLLICFLIFLRKKFVLLTAFARTSSMMLDRRGKSRCLHLVPDLREKAFSLLLLSKVLAVWFL